MSASSSVRGSRVTVVFVLADMSGGGAERTFLNIINHLDRDRFRPIVAMLRREGPLLESLEADTQVVELGCVSARSAVPRLARLIRKRHPDILVSTIRYVNVATVVGAMLAGRSAPVVVRETNNLTAAGIDAHDLKERLVGWSYRRARKVVALSNGVRDDVTVRYGLSPDHVVTIYNPLDLATIRRLAAKPVDSSDYVASVSDSEVFNIVAAGRLTRQKGFDLLIRAVASLKRLPLRLWILGDGPDRCALETLAEALEVADRVRLPGFQTNPYAWMKSAKLFVLSSRWEGFGHVVAEAMACGVPVLATRCPSGPAEIVNHGVDGRLCSPDSAPALAEDIEKMWGEEDKRRLQAVRARASVERFDVNVIVRQYEQVLIDSCAA